MQMRLYAPGRTNSACVYANVWGYDTAWSAVEWIPASGGQAEAMERTQRTDPYYEEVLATGVRGGTPTNTWHMFRVDPGSERGGMVRAYLRIVRVLVNTTFEQNLKYNFNDEETFSFSDRRGSRLLCGVQRRSRGRRIQPFTARG